MIGLLLMGSVTVAVPVLVSHAGERAGARSLEFFCRQYSQSPHKTCLPTHGNDLEPQ
jgi:hypothetical protein